jgi:uncharacterized protein (DUF2062 family)
MVRARTKVWLWSSVGGFVVFETVMSLTPYSEVKTAIASLLGVCFGSSIVLSAMTYRFEKSDK